MVNLIFTDTEKKGNEIVSLIQQNYTALQINSVRTTGGIVIVNVDSSTAVNAATQAGINALIDSSASPTAIPIGGCILQLTGPLGSMIPSGTWVACSGQQLNDTGSPMHGQTITNLNLANAVVGATWYVRVK